jgi:hypothetical protein
MRRFATLFWVFSLFIFLFTFVYTNAYLPRYVSIQGDELMIEKSNYAYIVIAIAALVNGALLMLGSAFQFLPSFFMPIPKRNEWMNDDQKRKKLYLNLKAWTKGLGVCINLLLVVALIDVYDANDSDIFIPTAWLYSLVSVLLVSWLGFYYFWFNTLPTDEALRTM